MRTGRRRGVAGLCAALLLVLAACSGGGTASEPSQTQTFAAESYWYVSPTGRDSWPGTKDQPWRTLSYALRQLLPGQLLYVRDGEYREQVAQLNIREGTADKRIVVMAYPGESPLVEGVFWLREPSYWTIDGIDVTWDPSLVPAPLAMVKLTGGEGWIWQNSEMWGSQAATNVLITGYQRGEPAGWSFRQNCVHDLAPPPGAHRGSNLTLGSMKAAGPGTVTRNVFFNVPRGQNMVLGSATGGPTNVSIKFNTMYGSEVGAILVGDTKRVRITRNILGDASSGLLVRGDPDQGAEDLHNVISQNLGIGAGEDTFLRPEVEDIVAGPGNQLADSVTFPDVTSCEGFHPEAAVAIAYGRYGVG